MDFSFNPGKMAKGAGEYSSSDSDSDEDNNAYRMPATDPRAGDFGEFHPRKRRRTGRDPKESAALGIFGSESEDDRHAGPRWKQQKSLRQQGMSFISSGDRAPKASDEDDDSDSDSGNDDIGGQEKDEESEEDGRFGLGAAKEDGNDDDDDDDEMGGAGLGLGASSSYNTSQPQANTGFAPASFQSRTPSRNAPSFRPPATIDAQNPLGHGFVPSSAYEPVLRDDHETTKKPPTIARPSAFFSKPSGPAGRGGSKFNASSFGARMMAKMGFVEGQGLGKEGHGRNVIIEANLRPQGVGVGAVKEKTESERREEKRQARLRGEVVVDSDEEEKKIKAAAAARRRKAAMGGSGGTSSGTTTPRRPKKKYMTMEEVKKAAPGLHIPEAFTPILDMTGPDRKLLTSSSGLMTPTSGAATAAGTPGMGASEETAEEAEARKISRRAQTDFMAILEEWQSLQNHKAFADLQAEQEKQELAELETSLEGHRVMTDAFSQLSLLHDADDAWQQQWDRTIAQLKLAAETIPESSLSDMKDTLIDISVAAIHPLFKQALDSWEPLKDPNQHLVDGLLSIGSLLGLGPDTSSKKLLEGGYESFPHQSALHRKKSTATSYETMVYRLWLPHVSAAVRQWDVVHDTDGMLALYEAWLPVLPNFVRAQLLEQEIVRRLDEAVAKWEPKRRRHQSSQSQNLPHLWLFPWLQYLPARHLDPASADGLVAEVKRKFRQLIDVWEFYRGVIPGLRQWKAVLRPSAGASTVSSSRSSDQWRPLIMSHVLPSMARYVRAQFRVDVRDQAPYLEVITGELQWLDLLAPVMVGEVMVAEVFPMWHDTLYRLLTSASLPGSLALEQAGQWFQWWADEVFPSSIRRLPSISAEFERGLVMINEALDLCGDGPYDAEMVGQFLAPPSKESSSRHNGSNHTHRDHHHDARRHDEKPKATVTPATTATTESNEPEEMSIRHYVEEWCETNDIQFIPERKRVHAEGRPLYRLTARGDGRGGVLAYFKGVRMYAETKKGPVEIRVDREEDWTKLLAMAQ